MSANLIVSAASAELLASAEVLFPLWLRLFLNNRREVTLRRLIGDHGRGRRGGLGFCRVRAHAARYRQQVVGPAARSVPDAAVDGGGRAPETACSEPGRLDESRRGAQHLLGWITVVFGFV